MRKGTGIAFVLLATLAVCQPTEAKRKSKKNKNAIAALVKDSVNADYKKVTKNAAVQKGLFTTLYNCLLYTSHDVAQVAGVLVDDLTVHVFHLVVTFAAFQDVYKRQPSPRSANLTRSSCTVHSSHCLTTR